MNMILSLFLAFCSVGGAEINPSSTGLSPQFTAVNVSSKAIVGVTISTQATGAAGALVTATCPSGTYIMGGGCECTGGVSVTGTLARPTCVTADCIATGFSCQEPGGTGGTCAAFAVCSRAQ